jgi:hypothetical protein
MHLAAILVSVVLGGCSAQIEIGDLDEAAGGDVEAAARMVDHWVELARSGQDDFGWWLVHPNTQTGLIGSIDVYRDALDDADWSSFDHAVVGGRLHDGRYTIDVHVDGGRANVPEPVCRWGLVQFVQGGGDIAVMTVRIPPFGGESGILGLGGGC